MARKYGKINVMKTHFENYSYIINGAPGVGKTSMAYELGKLITGSDEGTFIITCGAEPLPDHIPGVFGDVAKNFRELADIVKELCTNKAEYPNTVFVAIDSLDEFARITEAYVVSEWNAMQKDDSKRTTSIKAAYGGFQAGEDRATDLMVQIVDKLQNAGYHLLEIGHTKVKVKEDITQGIKYEQLTCDLSNKYYNALKNKVNLVAMCQFENKIENVVEKDNPFTKSKDRVGELKEQTRVMIFRDEDTNAIDTKSHFEFIEPKIRFDAGTFIDAVEKAIQVKLDMMSKGIMHPQTESVVSRAQEVIDVDIQNPTPVVAPVVLDNKPIDEGIVDLNDDTANNELVEKERLIDEIRTAFKDASLEIKSKIKEALNEYGSKLSTDLDLDTLKSIKDML